MCRQLLWEIVDIHIQIKTLLMTSVHVQIHMFSEMLLSTVFTHTYTEPQLRSDIYICNHVHSTVALANIMLEYTLVQPRTLI
jgi:hypothetical protein